MIALHFLIDPLQQIFRQRCVEAHRFAQIRSYIEVHYGPNSALVIGIGHVNIDILRLR